MAQTITLRAQGNAEFKEARRSWPASSRDSRYFISPARPAEIHSGKRASSGYCCTEAIPARSKPASAAHCFIDAASSVRGDKLPPSRLIISLIKGDELVSGTPAGREVKRPYSLVFFLISILSRLIFWFSVERGI